MDSYSNLQLPSSADSATRFGIEMEFFANVHSKAVFLREYLHLRATKPHLSLPNLQLEAIHFDQVPYQIWALESDCSCTMSSRLSRHLGYSSKPESGFE